VPQSLSLSDSEAMGWPLGDTADVKKWILRRFWNESRVWNEQIEEGRESKLRYHRVTGNILQSCNFTDKGTASGNERTVDRQKSVEITFNNIVIFLVVRVKEVHYNCTVTSR